MSFYYDSTMLSVTEKAMSKTFWSFNKQDFQDFLEKNFTKHSRKKVRELMNQISDFKQIIKLNIYFEINIMLY